MDTRELYMCSVVEMTTFIIHLSPEEVVTDGYERAIFIV